MPSPIQKLLSVQLLERLPDGSMRFIALADAAHVPAIAGAQYALIDKASGKSPEGLRVVRKGDALVVTQEDGGELAQIDGFYHHDDVTFVPDATLDGSTLAGVGIGAGTALADSAAADDAIRGGNAGDDDDGGAAWTTADWALVGVGVAGLGLAIHAGNDDSNSHHDTAEEPEPIVNNVVAGTIVGGPVVAGNDLRVDVYAADGVTKLGEGVVDANGSFSIEIGDYVGVVIARVVNTGAGADYLDEATATDKDLNAQLFAIDVVNEPNSTITININALTTVAYHEAVEAAGAAPPTADIANTANAAVAAAFGVESLHATSVVPLNGSSYKSADGLSGGEQYGAVLAALSGADAENGGNSQQTIDELVAGITITGGTAVLDANAQAIVVSGAETVSTATGEDLTDGVIVVVDKTAPTFTSATTAAAIAENSGAAQVVYTAAATDAGIVSYSLKAGGDAALFTINSATGAVTLTGNPDFEAQSGYSFMVVATDAAGNSTEQTVTLAVNDRDETAPVITSGATATAIDENSGAAQVVYTAVATDTTAISYSLKAGDDAALFTIDSATGAITLTGDPNFDSKSSYSFTVVATDTDNNGSEQAVTLAINNLDDTAPTITSGAIATAIAENSGAGQVVYTVTSTDSADVATGTTTYSLKTGGDAALFTINATTGAVTLTGNPNFETKSSYSFTVVATDAASNSSEQAVSLAINNLDEVAPTITSGATATAIDENSGAGQVVYTVTSTDSGDVATGTTTYSLKAVDDYALFSIDSSTGAVTLIGDPDYETQSSYSFTVVATDAASNSSEQAITLTINDIDEDAPAFTSGATATAIDENSGASQVVYTAAATDAGAITYSLKTGGDAALFSINATTGAVTLTGNPDHETKSSYSFTVVATDADNNSSEQAVSLAINDLDEVAPTITSSATATAINENIGASQVIYTVTSTDSGDVATGSTTYSLKAVDDYALFSINSSTGTVTLTGNPNFEAKSSYSFTVVATDAASNSDEQAVTLTINDIDEDAPAFTSGATATAIDENSGASQVVYTATATDANTITYSLKAVGDHTLFSINSSTGAVTLTGNPDYETKSSYSFTVVATDAASNSSEQAVTLAINNLDDTAPSFTSGATATAINENSGATQVVYTAAATDANTITYSLKAVGDHTLFSINSSTGAVTLTANPNYETKSSYSFTVVATDTASNSSEQAVTLAINNRDEVAPTITSSATATTINENIGTNQLVYTVTSTDSTDYVSGSTTYSLKTGLDATHFTINGSTGAVTLNANPDHETKSAYSFTVVATDAAGNASEQTVTMLMNDLDEVAPTITSSATATAINENSGASQVVYTVTSTDNDYVSGSTTYSLKAGGDAALFSINGSSGAVTLTGNPDYETKASYSFTVVATDAASNSSELAVSLAINDVAEANTSIVVFDLIEGVSSSHSSRTFSSGTSYTIYIRVDSVSGSLSSDGTGPGASDTWGAWSGAGNLGNDDRIVLVGNNASSDVIGVGGAAVAMVTVLTYIGDPVIFWGASSDTAGILRADGMFGRRSAADAPFNTGALTLDLWAGSAAAFDLGALNQMYLRTMPANVLNTQGLA